LSPLAFVAYLLPNTESWFKKCYKMFSALLMVFPVVSLVFGASMLAAKIVNASAGSATGYNAILLQLTALAMAAIPLFVVPGLLKASIAATGAIGGKLQGIGNKATGRVGARARDSSYAGAYMTQRKKIKAATRAQSYGTGLRGKLSKSNISGRAGTELAATGSALASREEREAVDNEVIRLQKQDGWTEENRLGKASAEFTDAMRSGDSTRARAAQSIMLSSGNAGISQLQASMESLEGDANYSSMMSSATGQKVMSDLNGSGIKGKNAALAKLAYSGADTKVSDLASAGSTYSALTDAEVAGQSLDNIKRATQNNGITQERAVEMMNNQNIWSQLSEDKKQVIRNRAASPNRQSNPGAGTTPPATPPPTSPPQNPSSSNNPDTPLDIDHTNPTVEPSSPPTTGTVDESGRYTPPGAPDDYHDRMQQ
jgi:hypothetical protein